MTAQRRKIKREYVELPPEEKLKLLNDHSMRNGWRSLDDTQWCLHCEKEFTGKSTRVYREDGELFVECGTPGCDGTPIDFATNPWWDEILKEEEQTKPKRGDSKKSGRTNP